VVAKTVIEKDTTSKAKREFKDVYKFSGYYVDLNCLIDINCGIQINSLPFACEVNETCELIDSQIIHFLKRASALGMIYGIKTDFNKIKSIKENINIQSQGSILKTRTDYQLGNIDN
jgi:hypothetical protein